MPEMKILLIEPTKPEKAVGGEDFAIFEPLALEYLAAGVPSNHDIRILDMRLDKDIDSILREFQPDIAGIPGYTVHVNTVNRLFEDIKKFNSRIHTVVGGHHATVMPQDFSYPHIDTVVRGEGVDAFRQIVDHFESGTDLSNDGVHNAFHTLQFVQEPDDIDTQVFPS